MADREIFNHALNGICPYFTMFPLDFPYQLLQRYALPGDWVLDPFCGRGTTNYASRLLGLPSIGIDSSPVAVALSRSKLANVSPEAICQAAVQILDEVEAPRDVPEGEFWEWAFHPYVLRTLCRLREGLLDDCRSQTRQALRAVLLGALHGPRPKSKAAYFSNQSPRTYAPKPNYAAHFWRSRDLRPELVDVLQITEERARRYYTGQRHAMGEIIHGDSRDQSSYSRIQAQAKWVITSPPYYGMRTYLPDQWLRLWFLGGVSTVDYSNDRQLEHQSPGVFAGQLNDVWRNLVTVCSPQAKLVIRFGGINDRKAKPLAILKDSLCSSGWRITTIKPAGTASLGRRQALHFSGVCNRPVEEHDVWAIRS